MSPRALRHGGNSSTARLRDVLVHRPGRAFGAAYDDPAHGFLHPVDLVLAQREHDAFTDLLERLGVRVHALDVDGCEVHAYAATEIGINGSGGPTCMTRAIWRETVRTGGGTT